MVLSARSAPMPRSSNAGFGRSAGALEASTGASAVALGTALDWVVAKMGRMGAANGGIVEFRLG